MIRDLNNKYKSLPPAKRRFWGLIGTIIITWIIGYSLFSIPVIRSFEWKLIDSWIHKTGDSVPVDNVAVIGIDPLVLEELEWPIDKNVYGELIDYLLDMEAKAIVFDILFSHNFSNCRGDVAQGDDIFKAYLEQVPNIILIYTPEPAAGPQEYPRKEPLIDKRYSSGPGHIPEWSINRVSFPYKELMDMKPRIAQHCLTESPDGSYRQIPLFISSGGYLFPHVSLNSYMLAENVNNVNWNRDLNHMSVNGKTMPVDKNGNMMINFKYKIPFFPLSGVRESHRNMLMGKEPEIKKESFKDKIVFIGASDPTLGDNAVNPMSMNLWGDGLEPKVFLHARAAATISAGDSIRLYGRYGSALFTALILLVSLGMFMKFQARNVYIFSFLIIAASYYAGSFLYNHGIAVPMVEGLVTGLLFTLLASLVLFLEKDMDRSFLFDSFKTYLSEDVIDDMYKNQIRPRLGGQEGIRTAFFTDIQGFSTFSEKIGSPTKLVELLNEYLSAMTDILMECHGTLDKYEGDAIIAFFGAPMEMPDHAYKACEAAVKMQAKLSELRTKWHSEGDKWPEIVHSMRMRIGINTGPIVTGNMGSHVRMNYTMMGDAVNLAARLESGAKQYGVYSLISGETMSRAGNAILSRKIDVIRVMGKSEPVEIYEILCFRENKIPQLERLIEIFHQGRLFYAERKWDEAVACFDECLGLEPHHPDREKGCKTTPSHVYIQRCNQYKTSPPGDDWDGVYTATEK